MDTNIITLDNKGRFIIHEDDALVVNLYSKVYSSIDKELYAERINMAGKLLTMIRLGIEGEEDSAILNLTWGVYKIGRIEEEVFDAYFKKELKRLQNYEGHGRVVDYVNTCLSGNNTTMHFLIPDENNPVSAYKPVEQLDNLSEKIAELEQMVKTARVSVKEMDGRLDEAEKRLAEKDCELKILYEENERMWSDTYRREMGEEYLSKMFKGYLKNARKWSQHRRDTEYEWLEHFLKLDGVPKDVKEMIEALAEDKEEGKEGMMVNTRTYVETQNNNYK